MHIRNAKISELKLIEQCMKNSMQALAKGYYTNEQIDACLKYVCVPDQQLISDGTFFLVEDDEHKIMGCGGWSYRKKLFAGPKAALDSDDSLDPNTDLARIRLMFVLPEFSGLGVGSLILKHCEQQAKNYGFKKAALVATQSGFNFYQAKAWKTVHSENSMLPNGIEILVTHMEKNLI